MKIVLSFIITSFLLSSSAVQAEKFRYRSSGKGGNAYASGDQCGSWPYGSYIDVYASESTTKDKVNGQPGTTVFPSMWAYFSLWSDCTPETATLIELDWENYYVDPLAPTLNFPGDKLASGSASTIVPAIKLPCVLTTVSSEWGDYHYYDCDYSNSERVSIEVSITWTGTGNPYKDSSTSSGRYPGSFYRYSYKGTTRDAMTSISLKQDGAQITGFGTVYGSLYKSTGTSMSVNKF